MMPRFDGRVPIALAFAASAILHAGALVMPRWQHAHLPEPPVPLTVELVRPAQPVPLAPPEPPAPATERAAARPVREPPPKPAPRSVPEPPKREAPAASEPPPLALRPPVLAAPVAPAPAASAESAPPAQGNPEPAPARAAPSASATPGTAEGAPRTVPPSYGAAYLRNPPPRYPAEARRGGVEGTVMLRVWVNAEGAATRVEVDRTSGHRALDEAAVAAVKNWRFVPAQRGGEAIEGLVTVPLVFRLDASG